MAPAQSLQPAPQELAQIESQLKSLEVAHFTADDAFEIGVSLRSRIRELSSKPAVISITSTNSDNLLFHATTRPGVLPDNDVWVARKRKTVKRWGVSSWLMSRKFQGNEAAFREKYMLGDEAGSYAIHGGGVPVRVKGVEGVVAVIVVSGLTQEEDHMVVVDALEKFIRGDGGSGDVASGAQDKSAAQASTREAKILLDEQKADGVVLAS